MAIVCYVTVAHYNSYDEWKTLPSVSKGKASIHVLLQMNKKKSLKDLQPIVDNLTSWCFSSIALIVTVSDIAACSLASLRGVILLWTDSDGVYDICSIKVKLKFHINRQDMDTNKYSISTYFYLVHQRITKPGIKNSVKRFQNSIDATTTLYQNAN